jgi:hypothetical protein
MIRSARSLVLLIACTAAVGCPATSGRAPATDPALATPAWVVFEPLEMGSLQPIQTYIWVQGRPDDFETVYIDLGQTPRFHGFGKIPGGYEVSFHEGRTLTFVAWSEQHELDFVEITLGPGENVIPIDLRKTAISDTRVPVEIWLDVLQTMMDSRMPEHPGDKPTTGT